jgi:hypothetical protein
VWFAKQAADSSTPSLGDLLVAPDTTLPGSSADSAAATAATATAAATTAGAAGEAVTAAVIHRTGMSDDELLRLQQNTPLL